MSTCDIRFDGQTVVVTGGTSGIGGATALAFAEAGAAVIALGLAADGPEAPRHAAIRRLDLDLSDRAATQEAFAAIERIDVLVNCAGMSLDRSEWTETGFDKVIDVNLAATFRASQLARPKLAARGGAIVNIASMYSTFGSADRPAYSASKGAISQLTKSQALDYAAEGIRVNAVAPGWIVTPLSRGLFADTPVSDPIKARIPMARWGEAAEVADVVLFLASPMARYITGAILPVDGGYLTS